LTLTYTTYLDNHDTSYDVIIGKQSTVGELKEMLAEIWQLDVADFFLRKMIGNK
jgi:hypothetical protein